jgi:hypothetical protein
MTDTERARELEVKICSEVQRAWPMRPEEAVIALILAEMRAVRERTIEECKAATIKKFNNPPPRNLSNKFVIDAMVLAIDALKERKDADAE